MRLYAQRRGQYYQNGRPFKFWETDEKRKLKQTQLEEREKQLAQIDKELPAVLRELLGVNYEREINKYFVDTDEDNRRLAFLSDDKRSRLMALRDQFEGQRERVTYDLQGGRAFSRGQIEKLRKINRGPGRGFVRLAQSAGEGGIPAQHVAHRRSFAQGTHRLQPDRGRISATCSDGSRPLIPLMPTKT